MFGEGSHLFPSDPRINANLHQPPESQRALLLQRCPKADKCEHSFLKPIIGFFMWGRIRCPLCRHKMPSFWSARPRFELPLSPADKGSIGRTQPDHVLEGGSRRRIWGILDFSRNKALFVLVQHPNPKIGLVYLYYSGLPLATLLNLMFNFFSVFYNLFINIWFVCTGAASQPCVNGENLWENPLG